MYSFVLESALKLHLNILHIQLIEDMATHSSALAWRIPGTGKPGRLPSLRLECNPEIPFAPGEEHWLLDTSLDAGRHPAGGGTWDLVGTWGLSCRRGPREGRGSPISLLVPKRAPFSSK